jgi:hypothetical protein
MQFRPAIAYMSGSACRDQGAGYAVWLALDAAVSLQVYCCCCCCNDPAYDMLLQLCMCESHHPYSVQAVHQGSALLLVHMLPAAHLTQAEELLYKHTRLASPCSAVTFSRINLFV